MIQIGIAARPLAARMDRTDGVLLNMMFQLYEVPGVLAIFGHEYGCREIASALARPPPAAKPVIQSVAERLPPDVALPAIPPGITIAAPSAAWMAVAQRLNIVV